MTLKPVQDPQLAGHVSVVGLVVKVRHVQYTYNRTLTVNDITCALSTERRQGSFSVRHLTLHEVIINLTAPNSIISDQLYFVWVHGQAFQNLLWGTRARQGMTLVRLYSEYCNLLSPQCHMEPHPRLSPFSRTTRGGGGDDEPTNLKSWDPGNMKLLAFLVVFAHSRLQHGMPFE